MDFFADVQSNCDELFSAIFYQTFRAIVSFIETHVANSVDAIGIMIMIQRNRQFSQVMSSRKIHVMDSYFNELEAKLWPRFKHIFDSHIDSLRNAPSQQLAQREMNSHTLAKNYANLACAIHNLNREPIYHQMLETNLQTMRQCVENKINSMAQFVSKGDASIVFVIQSYNAMLSTFNVGFYNAHVHELNDWPID